MNICDYYNIKIIRWELLNNQYLDGNIGMIGLNYYFIITKCEIQ